jgi:hypothetical protein
MKLSHIVHLIIAVFFALDKALGLPGAISTSPSARWNGISSSSPTTSQIYSRRSSPAGRWVWR